MMDGGTHWDVNIDSAVQQCLDLVDGDATKIIVDISICYWQNHPGFDPKHDALLNLIGAKIITW